MHRHVTNLLRFKELLAEAVLLRVGVPLWVWKEKRADTARQALSRYMAELGQYDDAMQHRNTRIFPATVGLPADGLKAVSKINALHEAIRALLQSMDKTYIPVQDRDDPHVMTKGRAALHQLGYPRLNRKEAFRLWPVLDELPIYLGFYWACTRKIDCIDKVTAITRLDNRLYSPRYTPTEKTLFARDLQKLHCLTDDEPLAMIHEHVLPEVNVRFEDGRTLRRRAVCPVFFPFEVGDSWPKIKSLSSRPQRRQQKTRKDKRWDDEAYIESLPVFRQTVG